MANRRPTSAGGRSTLRTGILDTIEPIGTAGQGGLLSRRQSLAERQLSLTLKLPNELVALGEILGRMIGKSCDRQLGASVHCPPLPLRDYAARAGGLDGSQQSGRGKHGKDEDRQTQRNHCTTHSNRHST